MASGLCRQATSHSLCLLDEFGKGTLTEGLALLEAAAVITPFNLSRQRGLYSFFLLDKSFLDGIGLLAAAIHHFADYENPPKVMTTYSAILCNLLDIFRNILAV